ncbi:MAG: hypothetical protein EZS28_035794 [Streblomastix strix]|uniref:Uncharacterized protein n=1 Tax=Streblomastix strix TaxID=222440 RepID=A0A5J4UF13_9EUKA|nr:MAG: hypothetical protein EZS28_035794 [Streblomastix strix]
MEETLQPQPDTGMGGKPIRYLEAWKLVTGVEFIQKWFFLLFKSEDSEKRLQERLRICPFLGSRDEETEFTEKMEEELRESIIEQIHPEQAKWFNPTFIIPKPNQNWRKILDASALNKEIQTIHFKMNGTVQVRDLIRKGDWTTAQQLLAAQDNEEQLNQQRQEIEVIDLEQNTQQNIENIPKNEQGDTKIGNQQSTQSDATHTPQTGAPDNLLHQQVGQNEDLNNMAEQKPFQPTQNFTGLLNLTHQTSLSMTGSLNEQQQQLSLSLSPSSSSITQINQNQQLSQRQSLFVTDHNHQFIRGIQQSKYIPIEEAVNRLPLLSEDPK